MFVSFVTAAQEAPGKPNYGWPGPDSSTHTVGNDCSAQPTSTHVPYKGGAAVINALPGDEVQMLAVEISALAGRSSASAAAPA